MSKVNGLTPIHTQIHRLLRFAGDAGGECDDDLLYFKCTPTQQIR